MSQIKNVLLVASALVLAVASIELIAFPLYLQIIPTNLALLNAPFGRQLGQSSKAGVVPRDYLLLTGDSYAAGQGDALRQSPPGARGAYASAHFLAQRLGRDVLSIGVPGWSTVSASLGPALFAAQSAESLRYPIPQPAAVIYYFYEGNDIDDNLNWARSLHADMSARPFSPSEIDSLIEAQRRRDDRWSVRAGRFIDANFPAVRFMVRASGSLWQTVWSRRTESQVYPRQPSWINRVRVAGADGAIPDGMQAPPLLHSEVEWANGVAAARSALGRLGAAYPGVPVSIVYLPSTLSSYDITSEFVSMSRRPRINGRESVTSPATIILPAQLRLRRAMCIIAQELGYGFIDATVAIRAAGRSGFVHGPSDWNHFNLEGYRVLGQTVAEGLGAGLRRRPPDDCTPSPP